jgi:ADP-heptose:LPS heptosyltransferase/SAM-dependent methyltransferase
MGSETAKCYEKRLARGDFTKYLVGRGIDIGCGTDPLRAPEAKVDLWDLPDGDAGELKGLGEKTYDFVYSSHCLEHLTSVEAALSNWVRVLKPGGYLYFCVPDYTLYEKEEFPSRFNSDHRQTFSLHVSRAAAGRSNHWNVREDLVPLLGSLGVESVEAFLEDDHYDYALDRHVDQTHNPKTLAQICVIGRKVGGDASRGAGKREVASLEAFRIYTGILGQIGDIVMFTPTVRRLKELFPNSEITFAVSRKYRQAAELVAGLPYVDRVYETELYFEKLTPRLMNAWRCGWPLDLRGEDEVAEQRKHDLVFETRPRSRGTPWWRHAHQVEECAHMVGVPGPIDLQTEIAIPPGVVASEETRGKIVLHNDPSIDPTKAWPWESLREFVKKVGPANVVLVGNRGPAVDGVLDYRGKTTLAELAAIIEACRCYVGIDSGPMWIAASLQVPAVGLYGTSYIPAYGAIHPKNLKATYLQVEGKLDRISAQAVWECVRTKTELK